MSVGPNLGKKRDLTYSLDSASKRHYVGSGTNVVNKRTWKKGEHPSDVTFSTTGVTFSNGIFTFDGTGDNDGDPQGGHLIWSNQFTTSEYSSTGCTIMWWSKITSSQTNGQCFLRGSEVVSMVEFKGEGTASPYFRTESGTTNNYGFGTGTIPGGSLVNRWCHFAIVFDFTVSPRQVLWYHDGELFHTHSNYDNSANGDSEHFYFNQIGRSNGNSTYRYSDSFKGELSNFLIYSSAPGAKEIRQNYRAKKSRHK